LPENAHRAGDFDLRDARHGEDMGQNLPVKLSCGEAWIAYSLNACMNAKSDGEVDRIFAAFNTGWDAHEALSVRTHMPATRKSITHRFKVNGLKVYVTVGLVDDAPKEIFLTVSGRTGTAERGLLRILAITMSLGLQYGVPLEKFVEKLKSVCFEPSGLTGNEQIPSVTSIADYVARWLELKFLPKRKVEGENETIG
jgi:hypothetical protein